MGYAIGGADCRVYFFVQAEDGIRDADVTGVQTCALPISVTVADPPSFTLSAPSALSTGPGEQTTGTIITTISDSFNSAVSLSATGAPIGTTVSFAPSTIPA